MFDMDSFSDKSDLLCKSMKQCKRVFWKCCIAFYSREKGTVALLLYFNNNNNRLPRGRWWLYACVSEMKFNGMHMCFIIPSLKQNKGMGLHGIGRTGFIFTLKNFYTLFKTNWHHQNY